MKEAARSIRCPISKSGTATVEGRGCLGLPYCSAEISHNRDAGKLNEACLIGTNDLPLPGSRRRGNDEVVGTTRCTCPPDVRQQRGVRFGNIEVVGLNRYGVQSRSDEPLTLIPPIPFRQLNANLQLRHGDRRDRDIITVVDHLAQRIAAALGVNQDGRIKD